MGETDDECELARIRRAYSKRAEVVDEGRYSYRNLSVLLGSLEVDLRIAQLLRKGGYRDFPRLRVLEVGCGTGGNLLRFLRWGFQPANLSGVELLEDRYKVARSLMPVEVSLVCGDAIKTKCASVDIVYQSTVLSSILDDSLQEQLAAKMWATLVPGGAVLWYDFVYNNPWNADVRGVPLRRVRELFPEGGVSGFRVTLAPPIGRRVSAVPSAYKLLSMFPFLRTHWVGLIQKSG